MSPFCLSHTEIKKCLRGKFKVEKMGFRGVVVHTGNTSTQEPEAGGLLQVSSDPA